MSLGAEVDRRRTYIYEIATRVVLALYAFALPTIFTADVHFYWSRLHEIGWDTLPYRDLIWEYPPLTLLAVGPLLASARENVPFHIVFVGLMIALEYGCLLRLRAFDKRNFKQITKFWNYAVLPLSLLAWYRLDYLSIFIATVALIAFLQQRSTVWFVLLGFLAKLWPVLFAVPLFAQRKFVELAKIVAVCAIATAGWYWFSPDGFRTFLEYRQGKGFQIESLPGSVLQATGRDRVFEFGAFNVSDAGWQWLNTAMLPLTVLSLTALTLAAFFKRNHDPVLLVAAAIGLTLCFSRLLSVQFLLWFAPFLALRVSNRRLVLTYTVLTLMTFIVTLFYGSMIRGATPVMYLLLARNVVFVGFVVALVIAAFRSPAPAEPNESARLATT